MDEILEVAEVAADFGLEGVMAWIVRLIGLLALLAGAGMWLVADMSLFVLPAALMVVGLVLLIAPSIFLLFLE
ncbi:hypothetical protein [Halorientalis regularis]|jgi:hypothetical protein|uniref:Major facilitator superfamily (MFS) profile domain-containing protein n=1 Tax=Halorientalis regularis TaxID=660518 RepID=A0A1G7I711_9EURY|nr:hypothetical protein [Halorientalis regularis]SDF08475.1 hypothetical protein SAMN05216218_103303 [Halorientalis regularis]